MLWTRRPTGAEAKERLGERSQKTRSGKIMRRKLRKIAEGDLNALGDTSTLLDPAVVDEIRNGKM